MIFKFEITEQDIIALGNKHNRPVSPEQAVSALNCAILQWDETVKTFKAKIMSDLLDIARGVRGGLRKQ